MKQMLNQAIMIAVQVHDGQFDKSGEPYILHVLKVMHYVKSKDEELNCIAVLHDVIEDSNGKYTADRLLSMGFSLRVVVAVDKLSKKENQTEDEYLKGLLTNVDAIKVKMADLRHNMDIRRLKGLREKDFKRLEKYARMYAALENTLHAIDSATIVLGDRNG